MKRGGWRGGRGDPGFREAVGDKEDMDLPGK